MWLAPLFLCAWLADSKSAGIYQTSDLYGCDFDGVTTQWGCQTRNWNASTDNTFARGYCQDANFNTGKFMWWTAAPLDSPPGQFSMRTGDGNPLLDARSYVPGRYISIYIRALQFDNLYKGLLLYAKNSNNTKVGDWNVPWEASPMFSAPVPGQQICNRSVMHVNAEDKPYVQKFNFMAPPNGTGTITIRAMIKTGPPNPTDYGSFYRLPMITLTEAAPNDVRKVVLLNGTSCRDYCASTGQDPCTDAALGTTLAGLATDPLDGVYPCHGAQFHDCTGNPRVQLPERFCTYHPAGCVTGASCSQVPDGTTPLFCICGRPLVIEPPVIGASPRVVPGLGVLVAFLSMGFWGSKSQMAWVTLALLFAAVPLANAHNWMEGTRGRASNLGANQFCSPTFPQVNRNSVQLQVGINQDFVVEWAAAHGDYTYWVVIHDDARANASKLTRSFMDAWLAACPGGGFANSTATGMKYHRFRPNQNLRSTTPVNGQSASSLTYATIFKPDPIYNGSVWDAHALNGGRPSTFYMFPGSLAYSGTPGPNVITPFNRSLYPTTMLAEYNPAYLMADRRCSYTNSTNPWIETIHRYLHHDVSLAFATATLRIPARKGAGRYQVHYKWSSFCDVIDVDVRSTVVASPYGTLLNATSITSYDTAHHCWFEKPRRAGQCFEVVTTPQQCQTICNADNSCKGYQMLPLQLDSSSGNSFGMFPERSFIPWAKTMAFCDQSQFASTPKAGSMVCFPIYQFQDDFNSARPLWSFTDDPDHQGFYGTCYIKPRPMSFLPIAPVVTDPMNEFRFQSKCIPCDNIGQDLTNPRWGPQQKYCTDCTKTVTTPRQLPALPAWTFVATGTFNQSAHWLSPGGTPVAFQDECKALALRDPRCSKYVMFSDYRVQRFTGRGGVTVLNANVNTTTAFRLINTTGGWHYNSIPLSFSYYRTCACLDRAVAGPPIIDATMQNMACQGVVPAQCIFRNFTVFKLP